MIRTAVIGCGGMGNIHADRYMSMPDAELVAVCDIDKKAAEDLGNLVGVSYFISLEEMLEQAKPEVVSIAVPTYMHAPLVRLVADYGVHIICEKPLALTSQEAEEAIRYCEERGVSLFVGHVVRFDRSYRQLAEGIKQQASDVGGVYHAKRAGSHPGDLREWYRDPLLSGGVIMDLMIHDIDYIRGAFGEAHEVYAFQHQSKEVEYASATFRFKNGTIAQLEAFWGYPGAFHTSFEYANADNIIKGGTGDDHSLHIRKSITAGSTSGFVETPANVQLQDPYYEELEHFLDCIVNSCEAKVTAQDALEAIRWAEAAQQSAKSGQPVKLEMKGERE